MSLKRKTGKKKVICIILILGIVVLFIYFYASRRTRNTAESQGSFDFGQTTLANSPVSGENDRTPIISYNEVVDSDTNDESVFKAVLLGDAQFSYVSDGNTETIDITDIPSIFDAYDPSMKIWNFSVVDLDRDGEEEVILFVNGVAGDMGGKIIFHQIGDKVYGYKSNNRIFEELKTDGTFGFSDPTGVAEGGIGAITDFSELGYTIDKISYGTGTYEGWNTFVVDHHPATEEEYFDAVTIQNEKPDAEWYDFSNENINAVF